MHRLSRALFVTCGISIAAILILPPVHAGLFDEEGVDAPGEAHGRKQVVRSQYDKIPLSMSPYGQIPPEKPLDQRIREQYGDIPPERPHYYKLPLEALNNVDVIVEPSHYAKMPGAPADMDGVEVGDSQYRKMPFPPWDAKIVAYRGSSLNLDGAEPDTTGERPVLRRTHSAAGDLGQNQYQRAPVAPADPYAESAPARPLFNRGQFSEFEGAEPDARRGMLKRTNSAPSDLGKSPYQKIPLRPSNPYNDIPPERTYVRLTLVDAARHREIQAKAAAQVIENQYDEVPDELKMRRLGFKMQDAELSPDGLTMIRPPRLVRIDDDGSNNNDRPRPIYARANGGRFADADGVRNGIIQRSVQKPIENQYDEIPKELRPRAKNTEGEIDADGNFRAPRIIADGETEAESDATRLAAKTINDDAADEEAEAKKLVRNPGRRISNDNEKPSDGNLDGKILKLPPVLAELRQKTKFNPDDNDNDAEGETKRRNARAVKQFEQTPKSMMLRRVAAVNFDPGQVDSTGRVIRPPRIIGPANNVSEQSSARKPAYAKRAGRIAKSPALTNQPQATPRPSATTALGAGGPIARPAVRQAAAKPPTGASTSTSAPDTKIKPLRPTVNTTDTDADGPDKKPIVKPRNNNGDADNDGDNKKKPFRPVKKGRF